MQNDIYWQKRHKNFSSLYTFCEFLQSIWELWISFYSNTRLKILCLSFLMFKWCKGKQYNFTKQVKLVFFSHFISHFLKISSNCLKIKRFHSPSPFALKRVEPFMMLSNICITPPKCRKYEKYILYFAQKITRVTRWKSVYYNKKIYKLMKKPTPMSIYRLSWWLMIALFNAFKIRTPRPVFFVL